VSRGDNSRDNLSVLEPSVKRWFRVRNALDERFPEFDRFTEFLLDQVTRVEEPFVNEMNNMPGKVVLKYGDYIQIGTDDWKFFMEALNAFRQITGQDLYSVYE
jgi:hypothetical protein